MKAKKNYPNKRFLGKENIFAQRSICAEESDFPIFYIGNTISNRTFVELNKKLTEVEAQDDITDFFIFINSYGGEAHSCLAILEAIKNSPKVIHTVCTGLAASAAGIILSSGDEGCRWISASGFFHAHDLQSGVWGSLSKMKEAVKFDEQLEEVLFAHLVEKAKISYEDVKQEIKNHSGDWHLSAEETISLGFADRIGIPKFKTYEIFEYEG